MYNLILEEDTSLGVREKAFAYGNLCGMFVWLLPHYVSLISNENNIEYELFLFEHFEIS